MSSVVEPGAGAPLTPQEPLAPLRSRSSGYEADDTPEAVQKALEAAIHLRPLVELFVDDTSFSKWEVDQGFFDEIADVFSHIDSDDEELSDWTAEYSHASTPRDHFFLPTEEELKAVAATGSPMEGADSDAGKPRRKKVTFADLDDVMEGVVSKAFSAAMEGKPTLVSLKESLEKMLAHGDREAGRRAQRRVIEANKFISDACVLSVIGAGWQVMFESALRELLTKHNLTDAWWHGPDGNLSVTPFQRTQALEMQALVVRFAEELGAFDKRILALHYGYNPVLAAAARKQNEELQRQFEVEKMIGEEARALAASGAASKLGLFAAITGAEVMIATQAPKPVERASSFTGTLIPQQMKTALWGDLQDRTRLRIEAVHQKAVQAFVEGCLMILNPRAFPDAGMAAEEAPEEWLRVRAARLQQQQHNPQQCGGKKPRGPAAAAGEAGGAAAPATPGKKGAAARGGGAAAAGESEEEEEEAPAAGRRVARQSARINDGGRRRRVLVTEDDGSDSDSDYAASDDDGGAAAAAGGGGVKKGAKAGSGAGGSGARGVPNSKSRAVLKKWLTDHFLPSESHPHGPFPTKEEKQELARQTGLTVTQVGDWFINARARQWRPAIERVCVGLGDRLADTAGTATGGGGSGEASPASPSAASAEAAAAKEPPPAAASPPLAAAAGAAATQAQARAESLIRSRKGSLLGSIVLMRKGSSAAGGSGGGRAASGAATTGGASSARRAASSAMAAAALVEEGGEEGEPRRARSIVEEEDEEFGSIIDALGLSFEEDEPRLNFGALAG